MRAAVVQNKVCLRAPTALPTQRSAHSRAYVGARVRKCLSVQAAKKKVVTEPTSLEKATALFENPLVSKGMWSVALAIALATDAAYIDPDEWIKNVGMSADLVPVIQDKLQQVAAVHVLCIAGVAYFAKEKELDLSTTIKSLAKTAAVGPLAFAEVALVDAETLTR